ncbi:MAG: acyl-CoA dehydrogenase family protein [Chloroflexi bacterium]|nr:acyl-CoA dehydrogenase family protein [Chloroflexota bacterium]
MLQTTEPHPVLDSAAALFETVRAYQAETERERCIPEPLVAQLDEAGMHRMLLPSVLGGLQLDIPTLFRVVELIAEADGSVGWNLMNNSIIQLSSLAFPDAGIEEIFARGPDQIIAGTLVPGSGHGRRVEGGYEVSGRWRFGSGCREASWMIANFDLDDETSETPGVYRMAVRIEEVTIIDTWDMTGMRGTASHDWSVTNVFVPDRRVVFVPGRVLLNQWQRWQGTLYQLPVHTIIGPHHSMIATGIARAGIDALVELAGGKVPRGRVGTLLRDQPHIQDAVARAEAHLGGGRAYRDGVVREAWTTAAAGQTPGLELCARCRLAGSFAADSARQAMDLMFRAGGTTSTQRKHRLAHCWRDLQVVGQAGAVNPDWYPVVGRHLLGLEAGPRLTDR